METTSTQDFGWLAQRLAATARAAGMRAPGFRSPPRSATRNRTVKRFAGGNAIVSVRTKGRPLQDVIDDMIEGVVVANELSGNLAVMARRTLLKAVTDEQKPHAA